MLENRLVALMKAGSVEKDKEVTNEQDVRLTLSGSLSLILVLVSLVVMIFRRDRSGAG